ncbi:alpha/beta fold hydrolase [Tellurirhabdus rosea]|uniref:alpha/beta fold hydrolase n=1 Tax=Tellurirhabdus rosea TaxID=2674997 RepID=UPI00389B1531
MAQAFNERGYAVTACDLPGHGHSPGKRGHVDGYEVLLDSVQALLDFTQSLYPGKPVVLLGHSMGGNIAANFLIRRQPDVRAAVIQAAWLRMPYDPPKLEIWLARPCGVFTPRCRCRPGWMLRPFRRTRPWWRPTGKTRWFTEKLRRAGSSEPSRRSSSPLTMWPGSGCRRWSCTAPATGLQPLPARPIWPATEAQT